MSTKKLTAWLTLIKNDFNLALYFPVTDIMFYIAPFAFSILLFTSLRCTHLCQTKVWLIYFDSDQFQKTIFYADDGDTIQFLMLLPFHYWQIINCHLCLCRFLIWQNLLPRREVRFPQWSVVLISDAKMTIPSISVIYVLHFEKG